MIPSLRTERLELRAFRETDLDAFAAICGDPEVMRYIGAGLPLSRTDAWRAMAMYLGHWTLRGYGLWAVVERRTGVLIGRAGLFDPEGWPGLEVSWLLARSHWGAGLATEAGRAAIAYGFDALGVDALISLIAPGNAASIRVAEKLGERYDRQVTVNGIDALVYRVARAGMRAS